ncbi:MAG: hypothetical protein ACLTDR_12680 [Adlercreutzia equolifaciens]
MARILPPTSSGRGQASEAARRRLRRARDPARQRGCALSQGGVPRDGCRRQRFA